MKHLHYPISLLIKHAFQLTNNITLFERRMNDHTSDTEYHLQNYQSKVYAEIELAQINLALRILSNDDLSELPTSNTVSTQ